MTEDRIVLEANAIVDAELDRELRRRGRGQNGKRIHFTRMGPRDCASDDGLCPRPCPGHPYCSTIPGALVTTIEAAVTCKSCRRKLARKVDW